MMRKTGKAEPWAAAPNRPMIVYSFAWTMDGIASQKGRRDEKAREIRQ
jgi:hypothetical protein